MLYCREAKISSSEHMRIGGSEEMAWLQICEPTEKDKGKYTFEIFDGKDNHQRSLDLSGQGMRVPCYSSHSCEQPMQMLKRKGSLT